MKWILALLIFNLSLSDGLSQYKAPILACVNRKTAGGASNDITWRIPQETCGAFQAYNIFFATNKSGPYTLLTSIGNSATTTYNHAGITSSQTYYYYMTSSFNCAGSSESSDTLSDTLMPYPQLLAISIENNFPVYYWEPVLDQKKIWAYVLINFGASYVDTVIGRQSSSYIDSSFNAASGVYTGHLLGSLDSCGERGLSPPPFRHRPSYLTLVSNPCEDEIEMSWTKYQGWGPNDEVKNYDIFVKKNSDAEKLITTNDSSVRNFRYNDFLYGDTLCIRIRANHPAKTNISSYSNQYCFVSSKSQVPRLLQTISASYLTNDSILLKWYCSLDAIPRSFDMVKINPLNGSKIAEVEKIKYTTNGKGYYSFIDTAADSTRTIAYKIRYEDLCNNKSDGTRGLSNYIDIIQTGLYKNEIRWNKRYFPDTVLYTIKKHELYFKLPNGTYSLIANLPIGSTTYEHLVEEHYLTEGFFCYKSVVYYNFDTLQPIRDSVFSMTSEEECIAMRTVIWMPNAFKINGVIPVFKPKMYFFDGKIFSMKIFNRWGKQIYETQDHIQGWNGIMDNGQLAPEESYVYHISYTGNDRVPVNKTGTFVLIR